MSPREFSSLPSELIISIMHCLETPKDLFNFIRAAKAHNQLFKASRQGTLEAVIRNAIPPTIMPDAFAACEASAVSWLWWKHFPSDCITPPPVPSASFRASRRQFIEAYSHRSIQNPLWSSGHLYSLFKLLRIANNFLRDFQNRAFILTTNCFPDLQRGWDDPISASERIRLLRGLFRFEVFRRLFPELAAIGSNALSKKDFVRFLDLFPRWEVEELLSIQEYLVSFAKDIYRELQDYLLNRVHSIGSAMKREAKVQGTQFDREDIKDIKGGLDWWGWDVFQCCDSMTRRRFQYLVARGLPFLYWLAYLPPNERMLTLNISLSLKCRCSFFELTFDTISLCSWDMDDSTYAESNESFGWCWANQLRLDMLRRYIPRQAGFVFWDADRLLCGWRLPETSLNAIELHPRCQTDDDHDWNEEPTIEERFKNILVPKGFFDDSVSGAAIAFKTDESFLEESEDLFPAPFSQEEKCRYNLEY